MIVAIDGPAGGGKSVLASMIAERKNFLLLNSGYFYRAVTYLLLEHQEIMAEDALIEMVKQVAFEVGEQGLIVDGRNLGALLHEERINEYVARVSSYPKLRKLINNRIRIIAGRQNTVCEGRDITSVVFPEAEVKIYLDASVEVRAKRRFNQGYVRMSLDEIQKSIQNRDNIDKNKSEGALVVVPEAIYIDSSNRTLEDVYSMVLQHIIEIENRSV